MKTITSAEFRKTYARLTDSAIVTANGHAIGTWIPAQEPDAEGLVTFGIVTVGRSTALTHASPTAQAGRDAILRKINKGG